jgi:hypothetical protein
MTTASTSFRHESAPLLIGVGHAVFSGDDVYRYRLTRTWGHSGTHAVWIMLNPSTADAAQDDPTIRRCTRFTKDWGLDGLVVVNLFALRATDPRELAKHPAPVGEANDQFISDAAKTATVVVAAWGAHPAAAARAIAVNGAGFPLRCLGVTKSGQPRHPLYVPGSEQLSDYAPPGVPIYVAPARYALTCLHRRDPYIPPVNTGPDPSAGATLCGLPMLTAELWRPVDGRDGDTLCPGCMPAVKRKAEAQPEPEGVLF